MKLAKKRVGFPLREWLFALIVFLLIIGGLYKFGIIKKDCGNDKECFNNELRKCRSSVMLNARDNNFYTYQSFYTFGENCKIKIKMEQAAPGASLEVKNLLEGKEMICMVPKERLVEEGIDQFENLLNYCHGELKEGLYELVIERMYGLVVNKFGTVLGDVKSVLRNI